MMAQASPNKPSQGPKAVNVMDIVDARSQEITSAMEALKTNYCISQNQTIPFHMRRRACGYNPKRRPKRLHYETMPKNDKACKSKKKKKGIKTSKSEFLRMETHLWHAKRCHMTDLWGYRLATTTTQKGDRAVHRAVKSACVLQDRSFYTFLSLSGNSLHRDLLNILKPNPNFESCLNRVVSSHMYTQGLKSCITPLEIFWQCESNVILRVHPSSISNVMECLSTLEDIKVVSYKDKISQFSLVGVRALELVVRAIPINLEMSQSYTSNILKELKDDPYKYELARGTTMDFQVDVPKPQFQKWQNLAKGTISQPSLLLQPSDKLNSGVFWEYMSTHTKTQSTLPAFIYRDPFTSGIVIVLPSGTGSILWLKLVYNGGRVIGLTDQHYYITELGLPSYPYDYPDTPAGIKYEVKRASEKNEEHLKRPAQKRVQYESLGIEHPFRPDWITLCGGCVNVMRNRVILNKLADGESVNDSYNNNLIIVNICSIKRGTVDAGSALYKPSDSDLDTDPVFDLKLPQKEIVGWVTSGRYSLHNGAGGGVGLMTVRWWRCVRGTVLVRKNSSRQFRRIKVNIVVDV